MRWLLLANFNVHSFVSSSVRETSASFGFVATVGVVVVNKERNCMTNYNVLQLSFHRSPRQCIYSEYVKATCKCIYKGIDKWQQWMLLIA